MFRKETSPINNEVKQNYEMLFSPINIGKMTVKNRIGMPPILMGFANLDGTPTEQLLDYYEERAKGGCGLVMTEVTRINDSHGATAFAQLAVSHDYHIEPLKELSARIHKYGAKLAVQLHHPGRQNVGLMVGMVPLCVPFAKVSKNFPKLLFKIASGVGKTLIEKKITLRSVAPSKCAEANFAEARLRALRKGEIKSLIKEFIAGAVRCQKANVDCVELHCAHGYLLQQFLSTKTNFRTDEYGGSFENRMRFIKEIIEGIKRECGDDYPIIVRLTVDEFYDKVGQPGVGYSLDEGIKFAVALEEMGIDAIDVSSGGYDAFNYWLEPTSFECGWRKYLAEEVKKAVKIPVLAANLIRSAEQAEAQLQDGIQDFILLGRSHITDPHWANKVKEGNETEIKRCICCLYCIQSMQENAFLGTHGCCSINPALGKEKSNANIPNDGKDRLVAVVGAGVAGLTSAEVLAKRGFKVVVLEKSNQIGGQIQLANKPPKKDKLSWCFEDLKNNLEKLGVEIKLETAATSELIAEMKPYAVIIATGATAVRPKSIVGVDGKNVVTTTDVLDGSYKYANKNVVVIGSGMTGLETAELLIADNNKVTIVEMVDTIAQGTWFQHLDDILPKLDEAGTIYKTSTRLVSIDKKGVELEPVKKKGDKFVACGNAEHFNFDAVVLSLGARPVADLYKELEGKVENLYVIGDASKIGRIADATTLAYEVALSIK